MSSPNRLRAKVLGKIVSGTRLCTRSRGASPSPPLGRPVRHKWRTTSERRWATSSSHRMPLIRVRHSATHPRATPPTAFLCKALRLSLQHVLAHGAGEGTVQRVSYGDFLIAF